MRQKYRMILLVLRARWLVAFLHLAIGGGAEKRVSQRRYAELGAGGDAAVPSGVPGDDENGDGQGLQLSTPSEKMKSSARSTESERDVACGGVDPILAQTHLDAGEGASHGRGFTQLSEKILPCFDKKAENDEDEVSPLLGKPSSTRKATTSEALKRFGWGNFIADCPKLKNENLMVLRGKSVGEKLVHLAKDSASFPASEFWLLRIILSADFEFGGFYPDSWDSNKRPARDLRTAVFEGTLSKNERDDLLEAIKDRFWNGNYPLSKMLPHTALFLDVDDTLWCSQKEAIGIAGTDVSIPLNAKLNKQQRKQEKEKQGHPIYAGVPLLFAMLNVRTGMQAFVGKTALSVGSELVLNDAESAARWFPGLLTARPGEIQTVFGSSVKTGDALGFKKLVQRDRPPASVFFPEQKQGAWARTTGNLHHGPVAILPGANTISANVMGAAALATQARKQARNPTDAEPAPYAVKRVGDRKIETLTQYMQLFPELLDGRIAFVGDDGQADSNVVEELLGRKIHPPGYPHPLEVRFVALKRVWQKNDNVGRYLQQKPHEYTKEKNFREEDHDGSQSMAAQMSKRPNWLKFFYFDHYVPIHDKDPKRKELDEDVPIHESWTGDGPFKETMEYEEGALYLIGPGGERITDRLPSLIGQLLVAGLIPGDIPFEGGRARAWTLVAKPPKPEALAEAADRADIGEKKVDKEVRDKESRFTYRMRFTWTEDVMHRPRWTVEHPAVPEDHDQSSIVIFDDCVRKKSNLHEEAESCS